MVDARTSGTPGALDDIVSLAISYNRLGMTRYVRGEFEVFQLPHLGV